MKKAFIISLVAMLFACKTEKEMNFTDQNQLITVQKEQTVQELGTQLRTQIEAKGFKIIADVDHAASAEKVGLELRPTRLLVFGNPLGGTKLMQQDQLMGIELPLKILLWEDENAKVNLSFYNGSVLTFRYGLNEPQAVIEKVNAALSGFAGLTEEVNVQSPELSKDKIITKKSNHNADSTFTRLKDIVASKGLSIMAEVPHDKAAAKVDLELRPTRLLIFGNPKVGTLLMQSEQKLGIDLPLKVLVHEDENGNVFVSYYNASFLSSRYGITDKEEVVNKVNGALDGITNAVISE
ncbi:DUF302 domain-containing protein [Leptobacterium flavescens]|uniref:DUF302 domain-containing protein n=1 Tax=Leptobacterium flavescens TaxID=472055 RepID=A0A6P0UQX0_9FLAO|nr:DUF302 domain-containing protein [Leptobacterium flavescens]NER14398.1 DUF302 domain-containing protein [Leptobacterium flavescens]